MNFSTGTYTEEEIRSYISNNSMSGTEWRYISRHQILSEDFIKEYQDNVKWWAISSNQTLSEEFIREFQNEVTWFGISIYQKLSEEFIKEFSESVVWDIISNKQVLSRSFKYLMHDRVHIKTIRTSKNPKEVI